MAAITIGVDSVVESDISIYERRFFDIRPISDERAESELFIRKNGPRLGDCQAVLSKAMASYWDSGKDC